MAPRRAVLLLSIIALVNIAHYVAPKTTEYYSAVFHFARGLRQVNTLIDSDAACVASALRPVFKKKKTIRRWTKE